MLVKVANSAERNEFLAKRYGVSVRDGSAWCDITSGVRHVMLVHEIEDLDAGSGANIPLYEIAEYRQSEDPRYYVSTGFGSGQLGLFDAVAWLDGNFMTPCGDELSRNVREWLAASGLL